MGLDRWLGWNEDNTKGGVREMRKGQRGWRLYELRECYDNDGDELEMMRRAKLIRVSCHFFVSFRFFFSCF